MNIDPLSSPNDPNCVCADIFNLDPLVDHNSCQLLLALDVLDFAPLQLRQQILTNYLCKLAHGGTITVGGLDIREAGRALFYQTLDLRREANLMLYGPCTNTLTIKKSLITIDDTVEMIMNGGQFDIISKRFNGPNYIIECKRR